MDVEREFERFVERVANPEPARDEHRRELRRRVLAAVPSGSGRGVVVPQRRWRSIVSSPWTRWLATATVVLLAAIFVSLHAPHSPSVAWADVNAVLNQAATLSLKITVYQGNDVRTQETVSFLNSDRMRVDTKEVSTVIHWDRGKALTLASQQELAIQGTVNDDLWQSEQRNWLACLKEIVGSKNADRIGTETFEGHDCTGWRIVDKQGSTTVWADAKTGRLARVEMTMKPGDVKTVMSDFRFDPPLDESLFSLEVPKGYDLLADTTPNTTPAPAATPTPDTTPAPTAEPTPAPVLKPNDNGLHGVLLLLRAWAGGNGGVFPDSLSDITDWFRAAGKYDWSQEKKDEATMKQEIGQAFFRLNANQNWVYRGKGVKVGDAKKPVFWRPAGGGKLWVIYGDFQVRQVDETELKQ